MENSSSFAYVFITIVILSVLNLCSSRDADVLCKESERRALLRFKKDLKDPMNRLSSWGSDEPDCCNWTGVACHNKTSHVLELHLGFPYDVFRNEYDFNSRYRLGGKISPSLLSLKYLNYLDLSYNDFEGIQIPSFIASFQNLAYLNLSYAEFGGIIPHQLGNLSNLRYLDLRTDRAVGSLLKVENFQFIGGMSSLKNLNLGGISLSNAPSWFQVLNTLPSLVELGLSGCSINLTTDHVPSLINITSLSILDLSNNILGPSLPSWIFSLTNLDSLHLESTSLDGSILYGLTNMTSHLKSLDLSWNSFNSTIPQWICGFNHLEHLYLRDCHLVGQTPSCIGNLTSIRNLELSENGLEGEIPNSLGNLCSLEKLDLWENKLYGSISKIVEGWSRCTVSSIESLDFGFNKFSGQLPKHLGELRNLVGLIIRDNFFFGPIPTSIGNLSSLQTLFASSNQLNGSLPKSFGQLVELERLDISNNSFKGLVSEVHFCNFTRLKFLEASGNSMVLKTSSNWVPPFQLRMLSLNSWFLGPQMPAWIQWQHQLSALFMSNTGISDKIPAWFCNFSSNLETLSLSHNQFHGEFPCAIIYTDIDLSSNQFNGSLPLVSSKVELLDFSNNLFSGSLFHFLCSINDNSTDSMVYNLYINLGNNLLSGVIPNCWKKWTSLLVLNLRDNNLDGVLPTSLGYLLNLFSLQLSNNNLSGELPLSLQRCTVMDTLDISGNKFVGRIPKWMGTSFSKLKILNLRSNKFDGDIPLMLCSLQYLQILDMAHNNLSGTIPNCFSKLSAMTTLENLDTMTSISYLYVGTYPYGYEVKDDIKLVIKRREVSYNTTLNLVRIIDLSDNNIHGGIPLELTRLLGLQALNLSFNHLTGKIPSRIGEMKHLETLDLSRNQLHGEIPTSISILTFLSYLDLSYNNLTGHIPTSTQLQSFDESWFVGNHLCGPPLHQNCSATTESTHALGGKQGARDSSSDQGYLYLSLGLGFAFGFWGLLGSLLLNTPWSITCHQFVDKVVLKLSAFFHLSVYA